MSKEILDRLSAVEVAQNALTNRVALVEQSQNHMAEMFTVKFDGFGVQLRSLETIILGWETKLDKMMALVTSATTDNMASAAGRQLVTDIASVKAEFKTELAEVKAQALIDRAIGEKNAAKVNSAFAVISAVKWVGFPALAMMIIGGIILFAKLNHLL